MSRLAPLSGLRPAPALALPCVLWAALGLAVSTGTLPWLAWWLAGAVLAGVLWFDARRLCRGDVAHLFLNPRRFAFYG